MDKAHAERLSLLLEHTNRQIREVHIRLVAFDWYIGVKYRGDVALTATVCQQTNENFKENSKIGVINEILQMCNTTTTTTTKTTNNLNNQMETTATTTTTSSTKAEFSTNIIESSQNILINNNKEEVVNVKSLLKNNNNNNNNIFNVYKPDQIRKVASTTTFNHNRHPFFYIG
ncbi:hypothetical protein FF38_00793 [Lucilia cuprina]|uniref:Uncharacterized protein n=1 Tax=Lucilia cuprina TaxID=7375 RepID=A0A0L0BTW3_LUCCU|nr:hypothetical protein FF38_00793 [Lucilia cuprina]